MLVFVETGKPENPENNTRSKDENQQQTVPRYKTGPVSEHSHILVGAELSHHCTNPAPKLIKICLDKWIYIVFDGIWIRQINKEFTALKDFLSTI